MSAIYYTPIACIVAAAIELGLGILVGKLLKAARGGCDDEE